MFYGINNKNTNYIMAKGRKIRSRLAARKAGNKNVIRKIGSEGGYLVNQCPVLIPKENMKMFTAM